ncbi:hypothetical protein BO86DRAFT_382540 [Aspergillus japonicus CBS 114.51]|uniref:Biogenesis of lysosome-related organelles complex 1 subunit 1 n=1 Tax=Aspergillus japonicus CBS 114.51 TaxID=1448312 RepID=A0A8T8WQS8_ASPJA|nr:hypothetical protein BO86DRAFT_382540 [Aspergillus japonicus CBS 114.51]RAH77912.1 hypothetical protein BO86DRAFT_382540 [Aspergillus japonicus CBS 114.51]
MPDHPTATLTTTNTTPAPAPAPAPADPPPTSTSPQTPQPPQPRPSTTTTTTEATEARTAFTATLRSTAQTHETQLRERARILHDNASALERQEHALAGATAALAAQNAQLTKTADAARDALKEIGDVQNWAEVIERELLVVEETLRLVEGPRNHHHQRGYGDREGGDLYHGDGVGEGDQDEGEPRLVNGAGNGVGNGKVRRNDTRTGEGEEDDEGDNGDDEESQGKRRSGWFRWW